MSAHAVASWLFALTIVIGPVRDCARAWDYRLAYSETVKRLERLLSRDAARRQSRKRNREIPGLVSPAVPPLRGSLRTNLARGIEPIDDEDLLAVLRRCRLDIVFPEGLETRLSAGAAGLPAGIRARLALARALVRDPRLLLIDDPVLMADRDGRAALSEIASARQRITLVAVDEP